jgi:hypothetical protein
LDTALVAGQDAVGDEVEVAPDVVGGEHGDTIDGGEDDDDGCC